MATSSPTWYDVLGVARDASAEEIKAAWRQATDRFEPGSASGQFRMYNEAADTLLDPQRRREYDASLSGETPDGASRGESPEDVPPPPRPEEEPEEPEEAEDPQAQEAPGPEQAGVLVRTLGGISPVVLAVLAVLTVAAIVGAVVLGVNAQQDARVEGARDEVPAASERAVKALFSYDYRELDANRKRAQGYLTSDFAKTYLRNFDALKEQKDGTPGLAVQGKTVVTADVQGSGVVDVDEGGDAARVLVFVNLVARKADGDPQIFQNRVAVTMKKDGDRWLVDKVTSY